VPGLVLSVWAAHRVKTTFAKWDKVDSGISMNAFDFARYLLNSQGLNQVTVEPTPGTLTDHYDPRTSTLRISTGVANAAGRQTLSPVGGMGGGGMGGGMGAPMGRGYAYGASTVPGYDSPSGRQ